MTAPPTARTRKKRPASRRRDRGVALIIAVIAIALLTAVGSEFAYNQSVDLARAANHRDEIRAYYLARSGIGMSRMLLRFQKQLDAVMGNVAGQIPPGLKELAGGMMPTSMNIQLWRMAKVDCHLLGGMVNQGPGDPRDAKSGGGGGKFDFDAEFPELAEAQATKDFGGFKGCFHAEISDEEERINLNRLNTGGLSSRPVAQALSELMKDKKFEFLFEGQDSNGVSAEPEDIIIAMRDWADEDETQSAINLTPNSPETFVAGFADEDTNYDRFDPRYKAKNARFDTLDEVFRVHGVNDRFMAAFKDRLTVFPDMNAKLNVNTTDPLIMRVIILSLADPIRMDPRLYDEVFMSELIKQIQLSRMIPLIGIGVSDIISVMEAAGIAVNPSIKANVAGNNVAGDKSNTYRIVSVGEAGAVQKTITTVVRLDDGLGRLVYWREE